MRLTEQVHQILKRHVRAGDFVIDATAGNGHDTQFLADQVGPSGRVWAIDLQSEAIDATRQRLSAAGKADSVFLVQADHSDQLENAPKTEHGTAAAVIFNLGYLPGSDQSIRTQPGKTLRALEAATKLLCVGGYLCVTAYRAHPGGEEEARQVENWMRTRQAEGWQVQCIVPDSKNLPPVLWVAVTKTPAAAGSAKPRHHPNPRP